MGGHQLDEPKAAFAYLRPSCVLLTKDPTPANVEALGVRLRGVSDGALQQLQDYVLFPLRFVLKVPCSKREALVQSAMAAMTYVLENSCVQSWGTLRELLSELCLCLCRPKDPGSLAVTSEELKLSVLRCLDALLHSAYGDIVFKLYEPIMRPGLGAALSLLLAVAEQEKSRDVQAASLRCLLSLFLQCDCGNQHVEPGPDERRLLGDALATFLPGISRALSHVVGGDVRQGHGVTVKAMRVWYRSVSLVMADEDFQGSDGCGTSSRVGLGKLEELVVDRTPSWCRTTSQRLSLVLQKIVSVTSAHWHWRVRLELVDLSHRLLSRCSRSLRDCAGLLLEALVGAVNDAEPRVKERCDAVLEQVARRGGPDFGDVLSENLHSLTSSLPRLMRTSEDQRKLFVLNAFLGYLRILGPKVDGVLSSGAHLQRISRALVQVMELDVSDVKIIEERSVTSSSDLQADGERTAARRKYFLYFTDEQIFRVLKQICRTLGCHGNLYVLVDTLLDLYRESSAYRKQAALVLNELVVGAAGIGVEAHQSTQPKSPQDLKSAVHSAMEEYLSLANWHLPTVSETPEDSPSPASVSRPPLSQSPTLHQLNSNIWQICIQLEGIAGFARALGGDFRLLLMTSLYPVLEKAGDQSLLISQSALAATCDISEACGYGSPRELVLRNSDYLLNDVSLNLARPDVHPHAPRVLAVMFRHSDVSLLPLVADVVQDVLRALDLSYQQKTPQFCSVLHSVMKALVRWFPVRERATERVKESPSDDCTSLKQFLLDYLRQKDLAEGLGLEEDEDPEDLEVPPAAPPPDQEDEEEDPAVMKELPLHIRLSKEIMERCIHLLSDPALRTRLKVLEIVESCVCVLAQQESQLLPMMHRCWSALLPRLLHDHPLAAQRAFQVLCVMGRWSGDFLRRRVCKEVLPRLCASLCEQAELSARAGPVYTHTQAYKLQLTVLQGLGPLSVALDLMDADLEQVMEACLPYLSCRQPIRLQEACLSVFQHLMDVDADLCWTRLVELHCPVPLQPPHPDLTPIRLSQTSTSRNQFTDNVLRLLQEPNS